MQTGDRLADPILMTVEQLAEHLRVDLSKIYEMLRNDHLPYVRVGSDIRFDRHEIDAWLTRRKKSA